MSIEEEFRFDVRIQERMLNKGLVKQEELEQRLGALKDLVDDTDVLDLEQPGLTRLVPEQEKEGL